MATNKIISPYFENGVFAGVRVTLGDEDFVITPKDYKYGKRMLGWAILYEPGLSTFNYRQICLTMAYRDDVNRILVENGGDSLNNKYWTCTKFSTDFLFYYNGSIGKLDLCNEYDMNIVRPIKNLK